MNEDITTTIGTEVSRPRLDMVGKRGRDTSIPTCTFEQRDKASAADWREKCIRRIGQISLLLTVLLIATGCQLTQSGFDRTASTAGAAFAAAATTITYAHTGKTTTAYARSSFVNYRSELDGLDQQLPSQDGAPDKRTVQHLLDLYKPAMEAVNQPCLEASCNWRAQVAVLNQASQAFLKAGGQ